MEWYIGVDGGGTKTDFAVCATDGVAVTILKRGGCSYQTIGVEKAVALISEGVSESLAAVGAKLADCVGCCLGIPCYGESAEHDKVLLMKLTAALAPAPIYLTNDVEVGWAGSLECGEGIHLVAGTGSIAFGRGADKETSRCGGWVEFFGDEGSCYWVGRETMSLFSKEADGRAPRNALYDLVRKELELTEDYHFIEDVLRDLAPNRDKVAHFQVYARQAAEAGDPGAVAIYRAAAYELALMVRALKNRLRFSPGPITVSYSGGLFKCGELILSPLRHEMVDLECVLQEPRRSAIDGALLLAIEKFSRRN